jgi:hypothetical protein
LDSTETQALERWLIARTGDKDVIASDRPAGLFLATGRKGHYFWPDTDPYALYYGSDRDWQMFYMVPGESESQFVMQQIRSRLFDMYAAAGVTHCIIHVGVNTQAIALSKIIMEYPAKFAVQYTSPGGAYKVYRVVY